jgi:hypothetical protein
MLSSPIGFLRNGAPFQISVDSRNEKGRIEVVIIDEEEAGSKYPKCGNGMLTIWALARP